MGLQYLISIGIILFLGSLLQGAIGFAFTLFVLPFLIWAGVNLSEAIAIISVSVLIQVIAATIQLRDNVYWRDVLPATLIRYLTIPIGIGLLIAVESLDTSQIKQILGIIILAMLLVQIFWKVQPAQGVHPRWTLLAFSSSGVMLGLAAMGGPPVVMWVMAQQWSSRQSRAFMVALFLMGIPLQLVLLFLTSPRDISSAAMTGLIFTPVVVVGSILGVRLGDQINKMRLRQIAFTILFVTATISIAAPFFG